MSTIDILKDTSSLSTLGLVQTTQVENQELDQQQFLELLIAQMQNQDPLDPQEGTEFLSQLAQLSNVEANQSTNEQMTELLLSYQSSQALQASALVGKSVQIPTGSGYLADGGNVNGVVSLSNSVASLDIQVKNASGELVKTINYGTQQSGDMPFTWDGLDDSGEPVPSGIYTITALAQIDGQGVEQQTYINAKC